MIVKSGSDCIIYNGNHFADLMASFNLFYLDTIFSQVCKLQIKKALNFYRHGKFFNLKFGPNRKGQMTATTYSEFGRFSF
jgi:hypothetical protein